MKMGTKVKNCVRAVADCGTRVSKVHRKEAQEYYNEIDAIVQDICEMLNEVSFFPENSRE